MVGGAASVSFHRFVAACLVLGCGGCLAPSATHTLVRLAPRWTPGQSQSIRLVALDGQGQPIPGLPVRVDLQAQEGRKRLLEVRTDSCGSFEGAFEVPHTRGDAQVAVRLGRWETRFQVALRPELDVWVGSPLAVASDGRVPVQVLARQTRGNQPWDGEVEILAGEVVHRVSIRGGTGRVVLPAGVVAAVGPTHLVRGALAAPGPLGTPPSEAGGAPGPLLLDGWVGDELVETRCGAWTDVTGAATTHPGPVRWEGWRPGEGGTLRVETHATVPGSDGSGPALRVTPPAPWAGQPWDLQVEGTEEGRDAWFFVGAADMVAARSAPVGLAGGAPPLEAGTMRGPPAPAPLVSVVHTVPDGRMVVLAEAGGAAGEAARVHLESSTPAVDTDIPVAFAAREVDGDVRVGSGAVRVRAVLPPTGIPTFREGDRVHVDLLRGGEAPRLLAVEEPRGVEVAVGDDGTWLVALVADSAAFRMRLGDGGTEWTQRVTVPILRRDEIHGPPPQALVEMEQGPDPIFHDPHGGWSLYPGEGADVLSTALALQRGASGTAADVAFLQAQQLSDGSFPPPPSHGRRLGRTDRDDRFLVTCEVARALSGQAGAGRVRTGALGFIEREAGFRRDPLALFSALSILPPDSEARQGLLERAEAWGRSPVPSGLLLPYRADHRGATERLETLARAVVGTTVAFPVPPEDVSFGRVEARWTGAPRRVGEVGEVSVTGEVRDGLPAVVLELPAVLGWETGLLEDALDGGQARDWAVEGSLLVVHVPRGAFRLRVPVVGKRPGKASPAVTAVWDAGMGAVVAREASLPLPVTVEGSQGAVTGGSP